MGQGQGDIAIRALHEMAARGGWLCLQNLHLVIDWVPILEKELDSISLHKDFRLWLTSEPHERFSSYFLKRCLKITTESPPGTHTEYSPKTFADY